MWEVDIRSPRGSDQDIGNTVLEDALVETMKA